MGLSRLVNAVEQMKTPKTLEDLFMEGYRKSVLENQICQPTPTDTFRPSSLADGCKRMLYYQRKGLGGDSKLKDVSIIEICDNGTDRHDRIQKTIQQMEGVEWVDIEEHVKQLKDRNISTEFVSWNSDKTEARCKNEDLHIYFQCDGLIRYNDKLIILEIKTMNSYTYNKANQPIEKHIRQATCYGMGLGVDDILFIYEDRNFMNKKLFHYTLTDEDKEYIVNKIESVEEALKTDTVPKKELDKCLYCSKKEYCKNA